MKAFTKKDLQTCIGLNTPIPWRTVNLQVEYKKSGTVRAYIKRCVTPFYAKREDYYGENIVVAKFINYWIGSTIIEDINSDIGAYMDVLATHKIKINQIITLRGYIYQISKD